MDVAQPVVPQVWSVAQALQDGVHEALKSTTPALALAGRRTAAAGTRSTSHRVAQVLEPHQAGRALVLLRQKSSFNLAHLKNQRTCDGACVMDTVSHALIG